jgi:hypothetical protein
MGCGYGSVSWPFDFENKVLMPHANAIQWATKIYTWQRPL